jgi:hypothetical protein
MQTWFCRNEYGQGVKAVLRSPCAHAGFVASSTTLVGQKALESLGNAVLAITRRQGNPQAGAYLLIVEDVRRRYPRFCALAPLALGSPAKP